MSIIVFELHADHTSSSAITEGPRDALSQFQVSFIKMHKGRLTTYNASASLNLVSCCTTVRKITFD